MGKGIDDGTFLAQGDGGETTPGLFCYLSRYGSRTLLRPRVFVRECKRHASFTFPPSCLFISKCSFVKSRGLVYPSLQPVNLVKTGPCNPDLTLVALRKEEAVILSGTLQCV